MAYALQTGGKRYRPILLLETAKVFSGDISETALRFAVAVEMLHTYSLVHDDLPCMDNDDYRRGQATVHKKFNEEIAVLCGDALLTQAFGIVLNLAKNDNRVLRAGEMFALRAGGSGMIGGQIVDLEMRTKSATIDDIDYIYSHKTCDLIVSAVEIGAILGGASEEEIKLIKKFAYEFGYCFQILDDIMDSDQTDECSILKVMTKESAEQILNERTEKAMKYLRKIKKDTSVLMYLMEKARNRKE